MTIEMKVMTMCRIYATLRQFGFKSWRANVSTFIFYDQHFNTFRDMIKLING